MKRDGEDAYYDDKDNLNSFPYDTTDYYGKGENGEGFIHKRGGEIDCRLNGRFFHMEIDMSEEPNDTYNFSICSLGLMGIYYDRDEPLPELAEVIQNLSATVAFKDIVAFPPVEGVVNYRAKQPESGALPFVSLQKSGSDTLATIAPTEMTAPGNYTLTLQYYNPAAPSEVLNVTTYGFSVIELLRDAPITERVTMIVGENIQTNLTIPDFWTNPPYNGQYDIGMRQRPGDELFFVSIIPL